MRTKQRRKMARRQRGTMATAAAPNQCWSMDFMSDKLADGRSFRILTVVDQYTRECVCLEADRAMTGMQVAQALERAKMQSGKIAGQHYGGQRQRVLQSCLGSLGDGPMTYSCVSFGRADRWKTDSSKVSMGGCETNV